MQYDDITKQLNDMAHAEGIEQTNIKYGENKVRYVVYWELCSKYHGSKICEHMPCFLYFIYKMRIF